VDGSQNARRCATTVTHAARSHGRCVIRTRDAAHLGDNAAEATQAEELRFAVEIAHNAALSLDFESPLSCGKTFVHCCGNCTTLLDVTSGIGARVNPCRPPIHDGMIAGRTSEK